MPNKLIQLNENELEIAWLFDKQYHLGNKNKPNKLQTVEERTGNWRIHKETFKFLIKQNRQEINVQSKLICIETLHAQFLGTSRHWPLASPPHQTQKQLCLVKAFRLHFNSIWWLNFEFALALIYVLVQ